MRGEMPERYPFPIPNPICARHERKMYRAWCRSNVLKDGAGVCEIVAYGCGPSRRGRHFMYFFLPGGQEAEQLGRGHYRSRDGSLETVPPEPNSKKLEVRLRIGVATKAAMSTPKAHKRLQRVHKKVWQRRGNKKRREEQGKRMAKMRKDYILVPLAARTPAEARPIGRPRNEELARRVRELKAEGKSWSRVKITLDRETSKQRALSTYRGYAENS